jgi:hypothetical protein
MHELEETRPADTRTDRDALRTRVLILEAALRCVENEADRAIEDPELLLTSMCRIAAIARQSVR